MSTWHASLPASDRLNVVARAIDESPRTLAAVLVGSWAHDMATEHSDIDLLVVVDRDDLGRRRHSEEGVDVQTLTLDRLRHVPEDPARWWDRYTLVRTRTLLDRSDGHVDRLLHAWAHLSPQESHAAIDYHLDGYLTFLYRSLKSTRDGRPDAARIDASESLPWALTLLFAVHGRVRPENKYLAWELEHEPLPVPGWESSRILDLLGDVLDDGDPQAQRALFALLEPKVREFGFGGVLDDFGGIGLIRGAA